MPLSAEHALQDWLGRAALPDNGRIPAERVLAAQLGISRAELRKALAKLEDDGRLLRHVGRGSFLRHRAHPEPAPDPAARNGEDPLAADASPRDLMRARLALEPILGGLASENASGGDIASLTRLVGSLPTGLADETGRTHWEAADLAFHRAVAGATRNPVLVAAYERLAEGRRLIAWGRLTDRLVGMPPVSSTLAGHRTIATAIADRDRHAAEAAIRHHLMVEATTMFGSGI